MRCNDMTRERAVLQNPAFPCPWEILNRQFLLSIRFYSFDGSIHPGQVLLDFCLCGDIEELFKLILREKFPVQSAIPIAHSMFHWDDELSMEANNTSAFNYRYISGTSKLSNHALGRAIDINPLQNPFIKDGITQPKDAAYDAEKPGTITADSFIVEFLKDKGWLWGGDWGDRKDYQHFEKP